MSNAEPVFTSQRELESLIGSARVVQLLDHDNDGKPDSNLVATHASFASAEVESALLNKGYTRDQLRAMQQDRHLRNQATKLFAASAGTLRYELKDSSGNTPFAEYGEQARKALVALKKTEDRIPLEAVNGPSANVRTRIAPSDHKRVFANSVSEPNGRGGF